MRLSQAIKAVDIRKNKRKLLTMGLIITAVLSFTIVIVTVYGQNVGAFVTRIDDSSQALSLSLDETFEDSTTRLYAETLRHSTNITITDIPLDIDEGIGVKNDKDGNYMAYSFYLKNVGMTMVSYQAQLNIDQVYKGTDDAIRLMVIEEIDGVKNTIIYAKAKSNGDPESDFMGGLTTPFESDKYIGTTTTNRFQVNQIAKYTVVSWLEGADEDCTDSIIGGRFKYSMTFKIVSGEEES